MMGRGKKLHLCPSCREAVDWQAGCSAWTHLSTCITLRPHPEWAEPSLRVQQWKVNSFRLLSARAPLGSNLGHKTPTSPIHLEELPQLPPTTTTSFGSQRSELKLGLNVLLAVHSFHYVYPKRFPNWPPQHTDAVLAFSSWKTQTTRIWSRPC